MKIGLEAYYRDWLKVKIEFSNEKEALEAVKKNGYALRYVKGYLFNKVDNIEPVIKISKYDIAVKFGTSNFEIVD